MKLECEIWLTETGQAFDLACVRILRAVERTGSLHKAAVELRMSNSSAWRVINAAEQELGVPVLERRVGGKQGGGSALTPEGRELLTRYSAAQVEVETYLTDVFSRHFAGWR